MISRFPQKLKNDFCNCANEPTICVLQTTKNFACFMKLKSKYKTTTTLDGLTRSE